MEAAPTDILDQMSVATPCKMAWEDMTGDNRVRFCSQCNLNVYNISEMTRAEADALVTNREGHLCARFFKRADGTVITRDCPVGLQRRKRRWAIFGTGLAAMIATVSAAVFGQQRSQCETPNATTSSTNLVQYEPFKTLSRTFPNLLPTPTPNPNWQYLLGDVALPIQPAARNGSGSNGGHTP